MFLITTIDGLIRRVTARRAVAGGSSVDVIVGFREKRSGSSKSPGPGWRQVPGEKRSWMKREPRTEERFVENEAVLEVSDWPSGVERNGFKPEQYEYIVLPSIAAGVEAAGAMGKRKAPEVKLETIETAVKEAGLAMPTAEEFGVMVESLWAREFKPPKRAPVSGSPVVTGRKPKSAAEKAADAEAARIAEEARIAQDAEAARIAEEAEAARVAEEARVTAEAGADKT